MRLSRIKIIVLLILMVVLVLGLIFVLIRRDTPGPADKSFEYVDKDTGETISVQPGVETEAFDSEELVTVIGLTSIANFGSAGLSEGQIPIFRKDLASKGILHVGEYDKIVKLLRPSFNPETIMFEVELLYKEGVAPARLVFDIPDNTLFEYSIFIEGQEVYKSGRLMADTTGSKTH